MTVCICNWILLLRYVLGHEAMRKMGSSDVLICGMTGLGIEVGRWMLLS